jgi:hypothetical protein
MRNMKHREMESKKEKKIELFIMIEYPQNTDSDSSPRHRWVSLMDFTENPRKTGSWAKNGDLVAFF